MDADRFDRLTRACSHLLSRRRLATALGFATMGAPHLAAARKQKRKKRKKLKRNSFGCVNVGGKCRGRDNACCSGICDGKKPKKGQKDRSKCLAHNVLDCPPGADECQGQSVSCGTQPGATCFQTTGKASFCAVIGACNSCKKDADCGAGGACAICPNCGGISDTACLVAAS